MSLLLMRALLELITFDILVSFGNFKNVHGSVRAFAVSSKRASDGALERISNAVNLACMWYPKQALCLQRAFVTVRLLRAAGVSADMVLGAQKMPFKAHAWVEVNGHPVNERTDVQSAYMIWDRC